MADGKKELAAADDPGADASGAERWYAILLLAQGWTVEALERYPLTVGRWASAFVEGEPAGLIFEQTGGSPALDEARRVELKGAVQHRPPRRI